METGQSARRRLSASSSIDTPNGNDEALKLLTQDGNNGEEESSIDFKVRSRRARGEFSKLLRPLGVVFAVLLLFTVAATSSSKLIRSFSYFSRLRPTQNAVTEIDTSDDMIGIRLHPEDHVSRRPDTIIRYWNITTGYMYPDGVRKKVYLINGGFPGPTIECRAGDRLVVHVTNSLDSREGVSIHWHGLEMRNRANMDGAVGFTQCPIPPGKYFSYDFRVGEDQAGTFWYHAHSQVERGDGMYGGLVVHKPITLENEMQRYGYEKEVLLLIGDWYHRSAEEVLGWYTSVRGFGNEPVPDSMLINGGGRFICSMALPARPVECIDILESKMMELFATDLIKTPIRLRIANVGSLAGFTIHVSSATLTPLTVDGGFPITGVPSDSVGILYPGERVDMLLKLDNTTNANFSRLHISLDPENFGYTNRALRPNQSFPLFPPSSNATMPASLIAPPSTRHYDLSSAIAQSPAVSLSEAAQQSILLYSKTQKLSIDNNHPTGFMNRTSWSPQSSPPLPLISLPRSLWDKNQLIPYIPMSLMSDTWVDIIINNLDDGSHPFHLHGNSFYVLASHRSDNGWGSYSPFATKGASSVKPNLNLVDPVRKDTVSVPRRGYVVIRFKADNEGIWMFHCHLLFHQASGMVMGLHVGSDEEHAVVSMRAGDLCGAIH